MSDAASDTTDPSDQELQDIVTVAIANTTIEAVYLVDCLDEHDIPAVMRSNSVQGLTGVPGSVAICCPRVLSNQARILIDTARADSKRESVNATFSQAERLEDRPDTTAELILLAQKADVDRGETLVKIRRHIDGWIEEGHGTETITGRLETAGLVEPGDGTLVEQAIRNYCASNRLPEEIIYLRDLPMEQRLEQLEQHVVTWLSDGAAETGLARYLAAAGLNREQADTLVANVSENRSADIQRNRDNHESLGTLMLTLGLACLTIGLLVGFLASNRIHDARGSESQLCVLSCGAGVVLMFVGAAIKYIAARPLASLNDKAPD